METTQDLKDQRLPSAWSSLLPGSSAGAALDAASLQADAYRLAFADPEFLLRRETRGIRFQLEMLKPDLIQQQLGVEHTVVVFGSARFLAPEDAQAALDTARQGQDPEALARAMRDLRNSAHYAAARAFARLVAGHSATCPQSDRLFITTGGGPGIMEAANRGAHDLGQATVGLNITLPHEQMANPYVTPALNFKFHYFAARKMHFMMRAKALVAFPGGFGTLDELFEVITLVQTRKAKPVPIVLVGRDYWQRLIDLPMLVDEGVIAPEDLALLHHADTPEQAWAVIQGFYGLRQPAPNHSE